MNTQRTEEQVLRYKYIYHFIKLICLFACISWMGPIVLHADCQLLTVRSGWLDGTKFSVPTKRAVFRGSRFKLPWFTKHFQVVSFSAKRLGFLKWRTFPFSWVKSSHLAVPSEDFSLGYNKQDPICVYLDHIFLFNTNILLRMVYTCWNRAFMLLFSVDRPALSTAFVICSRLFCYRINVKFSGFPAADSHLL